MPKVGIAIINPASGPGKGPPGVQWQDYQRQVVASQQAGLRVLGYVHTSYGQRGISAVMAEIDSYHQWYQVDGIFQDEVATDVGQVVTTRGTPGYYRRLYDYIKALAPGDVESRGPSQRGLYGNIRHRGDLRGVLRKASASDGGPDARAVVQR